MNERFLRLCHVRERVPVCKSTLYELVAKGEFPAPLKIGRTSVWLASAVESWIASQAAKMETGKGPRGKGPRVVDRS